MGLSSAHTSATAITVTTTGSNDQNFDPMQLNLLVAGINPGNSSTLNASYMLITHSTAMTNMRLKCADWNVAVSANVKDAYVYQGQIDLTGTTAIGGEACVAGYVLNCASGTITGAVRGVIIAMYGNSTPSTNSMGLFINTGSGCDLQDGMCIETQSGTSMTNGIRFSTAATITNAISCGGSAMTNFLYAANLVGCFNTTNTLGSQIGRILVNWGGTQRAIPVYALS